MTLYAGYRNSRFTFDPRRKSIWSAVAGYLKKYIPEDGAVLDLGSGYCDFINSVQARRRWALDLYLNPAEFAAEGVTPLQADVTNLEAIPDSSLDVVFASNILEHLPDDKLIWAVGAVKDKLRSDGRFIALQPNYTYCYRNYFDDYTHCRVFSHVSLADFLRAQGFTIERVTPRFLPFSLKSRAPKWSWLVRLYLRSPWKPLAKQMLVVALKP